MKKVKRLLALMLAMMMLLAMGSTAMASSSEPPAQPQKASITIKHDSSYNGTGEGREYYYFKVFSATYADGFSQNFDGGHSAGVPDTEQKDGAVSYTATAAVADKLRDEGNIWFDVHDISGSTNKSITWKKDVSVDAATVQAAAEWLIVKGVYEAGPEDMEFKNGQWESGEIDPGYYVIFSDLGKNLIAVTTDVDIFEKNDYPQPDKTQADEDDSTQRDTDVDVAIGDVITYQAKITIPSAAKVGETIIVTDTPSVGLTYNGNVAVKSNEGNATVAYAAPEELGAGEAWKATITVTEKSQGKDVIFVYTMTINEDALVDTGKVNSLGLKYGDNYTSIPDEVKYKTWFTGIEKVDGADARKKLEGVKFTLKENGNELKVTLKVTEKGNYYVPDASGSSEVVTDEHGLIQIRGLDNDKTYTLTETETRPGYNLLKEDVTLELVEDTGNAFDGHDADTYDDVENNKGNLLPSTGSIGTTIFYVIGGALVVVAGVVLVTRKRMNVEK